MLSRIGITLMLTALATAAYAQPSAWQRYAAYGKMKLKNKQFHECLGASNNTPSQLVLTPCESFNSIVKIWTMGPAGDMRTVTGGTINSTSVGHLPCAVVEGGGSNDNARIITYQCSNNPSGQFNEDWNVLDSSSRISMKRSPGKCMEPESSNPGTYRANRPVILRPCWGGENQQWEKIWQ